MQNWTTIIPSPEDNYTSCIQDTIKVSKVRISLFIYVCVYTHTHNEIFYYNIGDNYYKNIANP